MNKNIRKMQEERLDSSNEISFYNSIVEYLKESKEYGRSRSEALRCLAQCLEEDGADPYEILELVVATSIVMDRTHYV